MITKQTEEPKDFRKMLNNLKETQNDHMKYYNEVLCDCKLKVTTVRNTTG